MTQLFKLGRCQSAGCSPHLQGLLTQGLHSRCEPLKRPEQPCPKRLRMHCHEAKDWGRLLVKLLSWLQHVCQHLTQLKRQLGCGRPSCMLGDCNGCCRVEEAVMTLLQTGTWKVEGLLAWDVDHCCTCSCTSKSCG